uniref:Uncharacterized protein n=1 Tax=Cacopsylla melanoneura TaxID=428564 RepID=A0A8D8UG16_9HEMI
MTLFSFTCPALINQNFTWKKIKLNSAFSTSLKPFTWRKMYFCKAILLFLFGLIMMLGTSMAIAAPDPYPQYGGYYGGRGGGGGRGDLCLSFSFLRQTKGDREKRDNRKGE